MRLRGGALGKRHRFPFLDELLGCHCAARQPGSNFVQPIRND
jgi:hypothetical protein